MTNVGDSWPLELTSFDLKRKQKKKENPSFHPNFTIDWTKERKRKNSNNNNKHSFFDGYVMTHSMT